MGKKLSFIAGLCSLFSFGAFANNTASFENGEMRLNKNNWYLGVEALYGSISTFQNTASYAEIQPALGQSGTAYSFLPLSPNNWGVRVLAGYHLDSKLPQEFQASYLYLNNNGNTLENGGVIADNINVLEKNKTFLDATVASQTYFQYQTLQLNLLTHKELESYAPVSLGPIFGIRGTYIKNGLNAQFSGGPGSVLVQYNISDVINFSNEAYGIGPQVGENLRWTITPRFSIGGDVMAGTMFGNQRARYNLNTDSYNGLAQYSQKFNQSQNVIWAALLFSGQVYAGFNFVDNDQKNVRIEGGVSGDQYVSANTNNIFKFNGTGSGTFRTWNNYTFRDVFIRLIYKA